MSNPTDTPKTEPDNVNVGIIATVVLVGAFMTVSIALALTALVRSEARQQSLAAGAFADTKPFQAMRAEQLGELSAAPAWEDKDLGTVTIPVDRAQGIVVGEISADPRAATPLPPRAAEGDAGLGDGGAAVSAGDGGAALGAGDGGAPAGEPAPSAAGGDGSGGSAAGGAAEKKPAAQKKEKAARAGGAVPRGPAAAGGAGAGAGTPKP